jgi:alkylation response protein AidB-like acyl-CoA dehydrogenase
VPVLTSTVAGLAIAELGTSRQQRRWLPAVATGTSMLTVALAEMGPPAAVPATTARRRDDGWVLGGTKMFVPYAAVADHVLVPATDESGRPMVFVVDLDAPGVAAEDLVTTSGQLESRLTLGDVIVDDDRLVGQPARGLATLEWITERALAGSCVMMAGLCAEAMRLTAEYTKTRKQFDRPIATFQAVAHRAADAYIDTEAVSLTAWQAAWRLHEGYPAGEEVAIAKYWAAEGGQRVVHAAQHLHGGIGVDKDYPLHRLFLLAKHLELTAGGATAQLLHIGKLMVGRMETRA